MKPPISRMQGITLVEMAIVLLILGVLTRAAIEPMSAVRQQQQHRQAVSQLDAIRSALWAHVVSEGVLPCPLSTGQPMLGEESLECGNYSGGVPARRLALPGAVDNSGALLDPWNRPYQLAVSLYSHEHSGIPSQADWTSVGEASRIGIRELSADIVVCTQAVSGRCPEANVRASELAFVVFTLGLDTSSGGQQVENLDNDKVFIVQEPSINPESPFDDLLLWGSAAETVYWMLQAGWLP